MSEVRAPAVAGSFYPSDPDALREDVTHLLQAMQPRVMDPKGLIVPHAGYLYSGTIAAAAYACIRRPAERSLRVILLGPSHRVYLRGIALSSARSFATPLGEVPVDHHALRPLLEFPQVQLMDGAHRWEHSLEVQLPFLQVRLGSHFSLVPLVVGCAEPPQVAQVIESLWNDANTLVIVSSDLSHYHDYETARTIDAATSGAIEKLRFEDIAPEQACGCMPLKGLLYFARERGFSVTRLDLKNSGDTAGPRDRVVGYGAYAVHSSAEALG
ncbi:MAG: AmmeMemoRadiSam system protein B [Gammaproteobacteria bacterium]